MNGTTRQQWLITFVRKTDGHPKNAGYLRRVVMPVEHAATEEQARAKADRLYGVAYGPIRACVLVLVGACLS